MYEETEDVESQDAVGYRSQSPSAKKSSLHDKTHSSATKQELLSQRKVTETKGCEEVSELATSVSTAMHRS
jgi:hypothetical protein